MTTLAINKLWSFLQSLSMTANNERWLAERLLESADAKSRKKEEVKPIVPSWANYQLSPEIINMTLNNRKKVSDNIEDTLYAAMEESTAAQHP